MAAESAVQLAGCLRPFWYPRGLHAPEEGSRERRAREPSRNEECQCLRPGLPGRGWRRGAVRASGGKQGLEVGRTPRSCPCPMVLKDGGVGRREVENLGLGVGDRCWGDPPAPASADNGLSFSCQDMDLEWRSQKLSSRLQPNGEQRDRTLGDPQRQGTVPSFGFEREEGSRLRVGETASCCPRPVGAEVKAGRPGFLNTSRLGRRPPGRC